jgi:hypothetical protein
MQRFAGIFFHMGAGQLDQLSSSPTRIGNTPPSTIGSSIWLIW